MPMDEDAMFKALLKNKPQPKPQAPAVKEAKETFQPAQPAKQPAYASKGSEDAMFKALLHNRPPAQVSKPPARVEPEPMPAVPKEPVYHEPHIVTQVSQPPAVSLEPVIEPIKNLAAGVNQVQKLLKTIFMVLVLTLLVGLAILIKINL